MGADADDGADRTDQTGQPGQGAGRQVEIDPTIFRSREDRTSRLVPEARELVQTLNRRAVRSGRLSPLPYNLTISHEKKFVYFEVAKAATRTVTYHFAAQDFTLDVRGALRVRYPTAAFTDYRSFTIVRQPQDRFVSAWRNKVVDANYYKFDDATHAQMQDLASFVGWAADHDLADLETTDQHLVLQSRLVDLNHVQMIGRVESFDEDFPRICRAIGVDPPPDRPRRLNASDGPPPELSRTVSDRIVELYRRDFEVFGYTPT